MSEQIAGFPPVRLEPRPELVAPGTPTYRVLADPVFALYALPGFLLPLMHPATAAATMNRDPVFTNPDTHLLHYARRLRDTLEMIAGVALAGDEAEHVAYAMRELHRPIQGEDTRGEQYHAWTRDIWTWNWAAIVASYMRGYGQLRGFPDDQVRDDAYLGLLEVGRRFGVLGMPASYGEFLAVWPAERDRVADPMNATLQQVLGLTEAATLPGPPALQWMPLHLWAVATWPVRHVLRVSVYLGLTPDEQAMVGFQPRRSDRIGARAQVAFWRVAMPRQVSWRLGGLWLAARSRWGTPAWQGRFSAEALAVRRG